ncbi:hypothetical protein OG203_25610 [Nocardia sp. NBC_01499]|uniref:hypothetical protein n=1 Tax=Nocardia sp. NBC_01499 TaxID=2903597 RepID=UPI003864EBA8
MLIDRFTNIYNDEILLISTYTVDGAEVLSNGGGGSYAIFGLLACGLRVGASNGEMEGWGDHKCTWSVGLYFHGQQLAYLVAGSLNDQMTIAAGLTAEQARLLIEGAPEAMLLPPQIIIVG